MQISIKRGLSRKAPKRKGSRLSGRQSESELRHFFDFSRESPTSSPIAIKIRNILRLEASFFVLPLFQLAGNREATVSLGFPISPLFFSHRILGFCHSDELPQGLEGVGRGQGLGLDGGRGRRSQG